MDASLTSPLQTSGCDSESIGFDSAVVATSETTKPGSQFGDRGGEVEDGPAITADPDSCVDAGGESGRCSRCCSENSGGDGGGLCVATGASFVEGAGADADTVDAMGAAEVTAASAVACGGSCCGCCGCCAGGGGGTAKAPWVGGGRYSGGGGCAWAGAPRLISAADEDLTELGDGMDCPFTDLILYFLSGDRWWCGCCAPSPPAPLSPPRRLANCPVRYVLK